MGEREDERPSGNEHPRDLADRHVDARQVHQDHPGEDEIEVPIGQSQGGREIGHRVFDAGVVSVAAGESDHL